MKIGFFGSSHLSIVSAICAAQKVSEIGGKIYCYISDATITEADGSLKIREPNLDGILHQYHEHITFVAEGSALDQCDLVYVALDTPTNAQGEADVSPVESAIRSVIPFLSSKALLVVHSQVTPGFTRKINFPSNRLFYQVETLIFGRAVERALSPERFIIGAQSKFVPLPEVYDNYLSLYRCPKFMMTYESAELAKISINLYLTASVTTSNTLAEVCEKIDADWDDIAETLRLDKRIGQYAYLKPGLGISGGNLERDLVAIKKLAYDHGIKSDIIEAQLSSSKYYKDWVLRLLKSDILNKTSNMKIGILGLAYKENTNSIKNSPSIQLIRQLKSFKIYAYDPVIKNLPEDIKGHIELCASVEEVMAYAQVLVIMTPWEEFNGLDFDNYPNLIIDPYGLVKRNNSSHKIYRRGSL